MSKGYFMKESSFDCETDFLRMMILVSNEVKMIHSANTLHRDIKCENIMFYKKNKKLFYYFRNFKSFCEYKKQRKENYPKIFSFGYSSPEKNTLQESFASKE